MKSEIWPNIARKEGRKEAGKEGRKEGRDDEPGLAFILTPDSLLRAQRRSAIDSPLYHTTQTLFPQSSHLSSLPEAVKTYTFCDCKYRRWWAKAQVWSLRPRGHSLPGMWEFPCNSWGPTTVTSGKQNKLSKFFLNFLGNGITRITGKRLYIWPSKYDATPYSKLLVQSNPTQFRRLQILTYGVKFSNPQFLYVYFGISWQFAKAIMQKYQTLTDL